MPGGPATIAALRRAGTPFRCVTNTTSQSRAGLVARLRRYGYDIEPAEIITPASAAVAVCLARGIRCILAEVPQPALEDLAALELAGHDGPAPQAIVIGDLGDGWSFGRLQRAFTQLLAGADLIALSKDRYFLKQGVLTLDAGPFVAALEYASGRTATVVGKPSPEFYRAAVQSLGVELETGGVAMVGDDLWSDIAGAQQAGLLGWLVRTGKFREEKLRESGIMPDRIIESVAELAG